MRAISLSGLALAGACLLTAPFLHLSFQAPVVAKAASPKVGDAKKGAVLYKQNCAICHGETGKGDGLAGKSLQPPPRDFSKGLFKYSKNDAERLTFIKVGKSPMPGWEGTLTDAQINDVIAFIHTLKLKKPKP